MADDATADEDAALLAAYAAGDQSAARTLTERRAPQALRLARRMLGDETEAEDVAQEAMLRLWRVAPDWRAGQAKVSTWLHRVTVNLCLDRLRRRRSAPLDAAPEPVDETPSPLEAMGAAERRTALRAAIDALPERQKAALVMRHFEELGNPEIAEALDVSVEAVESLLARARRALAAALAPRRGALGLD